jgi:hypothetical protein
LKKIALMAVLFVSLAVTALAKQGPPDAPEIDPGSVSAASALVCVGLLMIRGRQKR